MKFKIMASLMALSVLTSTLSIEAFKVRDNSNSENKSNTFLSQVLQPVVASAAETTGITYTVKQLSLKVDGEAVTTSFTSSDGAYNLAVYEFTTLSGKETVSKEYYVGVSGVTKNKLGLDISIQDIEYSVSSEILTAMTNQGYSTENLNTVKLICDKAFSGADIKTINLTGVIYIGASAFSSCSYITEVTIPSSVVSLGKGVFNSSGLKTLSIECPLSEIPENMCANTKVSSISLSSENSLISIGANAFTGTPLTAFPFADANNLSLIDSNAFKNCTQIKQLSLPDNVYRINEGAFMGCTALQSIEMNSSLGVIDKNAFKGCTALTDIKFGTSLSSLGGGAFDGCTSLEYVSCIPDTIGDWVSVEENTGYGFGNAVFANCTKLRKVSLPESLTFVPESMFAGCTSLTDVVLSDNITGIAKEAFLECKNLQEVTTRSTYLSSIGEDAFKNCTSLRTLPVNKCTAVEDGAFAGCTALSSVTLSADTWGTGVFSGCTSLTYANLGLGTSIEFPESMFNGCTSLKGIAEDYGSTFNNIQIIGANAFKDCTSLTSVYFINAVILKDSCFSGCTSLKQISNEMEITAEDYGNNCFLNCSKLSKAINCYASTVGNNAFKGTGILSLNIKGTVGTTAVFGNNAFAQCPNLKTVNITIDDGVEYSVGTGLFTGCAALESATFTGSEITKSMFEGCTKLTSVSMPKATDVRDSAFSGCTSLIDISSPVFKSVGASAFVNCSSISTIPVDISTTFSGKSQFSGCYKLGEVEVSTLSDSMFANCSSLSSVRIGSGVSVIPSNCFINCTSLKEFSLTGIKSFEAACFSNSGLSGALTISGATTIGTKAFAGCKNLSSADISATTIGISAFEGCTSLASAVLSANDIQRSAFYKCDNLQKVTLKEVSGVTIDSIGTSAFADCPLLTEVLTTANNTVIGSKAFGYVSNKAKEDFWVVGNSGSTAEGYANDNGFTFVDINSYDASDRELSKKLLGDVDCNGLVSISDAVRLQSWLVGRSVGVYGDNMDMNSDGVVNVFDLCLLKKQLLEG